MHPSPLVRCVTTIAILSTLLAACSSKQPEENRTPDTTATAQAKAEDSLVIELSGIDSLSVLELLGREHEVKYHNTAAGAFVTSIGPISNSSEYCWLFSVNGTFPTVACDRCVVSGQDRVRWHFRRIGR